MHVRVRLFAALRERAGSGSVEVDLPDGAVVGDVWSVLDLGAEPPGLLFAVNRGYAERPAALSAGDEVAVIPPVSGGSGKAASGSEPQGVFRLSEQALSVEDALAQVRGDGAGAEVGGVVGQEGHDHREPHHVHERGDEKNQEPGQGRRAISASTSVNSRGARESRSTPPRVTR